MYWLLLSILTNSILLLLLKGFARFNVNTLQAIVVNYFVAGSVGLFVAHTRLLPGELLQQPGTYRLSARLRSRMEPIYFMRFCGSTPEMERRMLEQLMDVAPQAAEFEIR